MKEINDKAKIFMQRAKNIQNEAEEIDRRSKSSKEKCFKKILNVKKTTEKEWQDVKEQISESKIVQLDGFRSEVLKRVKKFDEDYNKHKFPK